MNELTIINNVKAGKIEHNYTELKAKVALMVEPYKGLTFTEETAKEGKSTLASLRGLKTGLDNERKRIKKEFMEPYLNAETLMKEVLAIIDKPIDEISSQLSVFEAQEKKDKLEAVVELKAKIVNDSPHADLIYTMKWFDDPRWENKTYTLKKIESEITQKLSQIGSDLQTIASVCDDQWTPRVITEYTQTGSLADALRSKDRMIAEKEQADKVAAEMAERRRQDAEREAAQKEIREASRAAQAKPEEALVKNIDNFEEIKTFRFDITMTKTQFNALRQFCVSAGIKLSVVKE
ncbi:MAG: DUF1351 domain-containing protein [Spirochaetia bacterium]|nr:DUF1351 domain-containing protein [Spirochaetia bacterium]